MINWQIDSTSDVSLTNLMSKHDLVCASPLLISSFGMLYFAGWAFGSLFLPNLSDKYGRKYFYFFFLILQQYAILILMGLPGGFNMDWIKLAMAIFFAIGLASSVRTTVGFCLMCDVVPKRYHSMISSLWMSLGVLNHAITTIYFKYISKDWIHL